MASLDLNQKQLTYIVLALEAYVKVLEQDQDDPGPSMADALYVAHLARLLRDKHAASSGGNA